MSGKMCKAQHCYFRALMNTEMCALHVGRPSQPAPPRRGKVMTAKEIREVLGAAPENARIFFGALDAPVFVEIQAEVIDRDADGPLVILEGVL